MILVLTPNIKPDSDAYEQLVAHLSRLQNIQWRVHQEQGTEQTLTEIYLIGNTAAISIDDMRSLPAVERVVRVSEEYRVLGRHRDDYRAAHFDYQGLRFGQDTLHVFAGLCAVDTPRNVEVMMEALRDNGQVCTRMGAYKPRTSPYSFRGTVSIVCLTSLIWRESMESRLLRWRLRMNPILMKSTRASTRPATPPESCYRSARAILRISSS